jgi:hypothetical protein
MSKDVKPSSEPGVNSSNYGEHLFNKMTVSEFFAENDRPITTKVLATTLNKIGPHLKPSDFDILYDSRIVALPVNMLAAAVHDFDHEDKERPAFILVSPLIETTGGEQEEELGYDLAKALAECCALTKNANKRTARTQIDAEARTLLGSWDYPVRTHTTQPARASA